MEAARSTEKLHEQEESSWSKARKTLESDLDTAESQLDKTKVKLDTEKKARCVLRLCVDLVVCVSYSTVLLYIRDHGGLGFSGQKSL